ncbi:MAG: hypothetical protein ACK2T3_09610 [Candidatus Promineifilaceae bacterium]
MTTLETLINLCEADLADTGNTTWSAADIQQWIVDAIADYSAHFRRILIQDITTSLNDRMYDLQDSCIGVISVEYPQGHDPPQYLQLRSHTHPDFWVQEGYYDHITHSDDTDAGELWISAKPAAGETIRVRYQAYHELPDDTSDVITVPAEHQHILRNYVLWRAAIQLKTTEEANPTSSSSLIMSQLAINVDRMRRAYVDSLAKAIYGISNSKLVSWSGQSSESSRIY